MRDTSASRSRKQHQGGKGGLNSVQL